MTTEVLKGEIQRLVNQKGSLLLRLRPLQEELANATKVLDGIDGAIAVLEKLLKEHDESIEH